MLRRFKYVVLVLPFVIQATAQPVVTDEFLPYSDSTSIPGIFFALDGPHKLQEGNLIISENTRIRFFRKDKEEIILPNIEYHIDDAAHTRYTGPFKLGKSGIHTVTLRQVHPDSESIESAISLSVDASGPTVTVSVVYKSITLKQFRLTESRDQIGRKPFECPVGSEIHVSVTDDLSGVKGAFLKEGKASYSMLSGVIELRSRGRHEYKIMASDLVLNVTESSPIVLDIIEP